MADDILERARRAMEGMTEGPWFMHDFADPRVSSDPNSPANIYVSCTTPDHITVASMGSALTGTLEEARANARFIAAAPTLVRDLMARLAEQQRAMACLLLWAEDATYFVEGVEPHTPSHVTRCRSIMAALADQHSGDCTRQSHTCSRCHAERLLQDADDLMAEIERLRETIGAQADALIQAAPMCKGRLQPQGKYQKSPFPHPVAIVSLMVLALLWGIFLLAVTWNV